MPHEDMDSRLRALFAARRPGRDTHRDELRATLLAHHHRAYPQTKRWTIMTHRIWFRPTLAALAITVLGVAACNTPTSYDVKMGQRVAIAVDGPAKAADLEAQLNEVSAFVETLPDVDGVWASIDATPDGTTTAGLNVWGQSLDGTALQDALQQHFPFLADAAITITPLAGEAHGSMVDALGHTLFHAEVQGETAEEVRQNILRQLADQGFTGDARVEFIEGDGHHTINVELDDGTPQRTSH